MSFRTKHFIMRNYRDRTKSELLKSSGEEVGRVSLYWVIKALQDKGMEGKMA